MNAWSFRSVAGGLILAIALVGSARADEMNTGAMEPPKTAEDSLALAKQYEEKAAIWRDEAAHHHQMAIDYKRFSKSPLNPKIAKMERHCAAIASGASKLAAESEALAKEYRDRAKEIEKK